MIRWNALMLLLAPAVALADDPSEEPTEEVPTDESEEDADPLEEPVEEPEKRAKPRHVNPGVGLGLAHMGATSSPYVSRSGFALAVRSETGLNRLMQLNFGFNTTVMYPERTLAVAKFGIAAGAWTTRGFVNVTEWVGDSSKPPPPPFKELGAIFAYMGLTMSYVAVPMAFAISPLASLGETTFGPTLSIHSAKEAPNLWFEAGAGVSLFAHPMGTVGLGYGPLLGVGAQLGKLSVGTRWLISPPTAHAAFGNPDGTLLSGSVTVGL